MNILKQFVAGLGQQNAPFGFAPDNPNASYQAGLGFIGDLGSGLMANNQPGVSPWANLGASLQQAKATSADRNRQQYTAQQLMEEAAARKAEREQADAANAQREELLKTLPPDVQMKARSVPGFLEDYLKATDPAFQKPDEPNLTTDMQNYLFAQQNPEFAGFLKQGQAGGVNEFGLQPVPLADEKGNFAGMGQMSKSGGLFFNGQPVDGTKLRPMDPGTVNFEKASGAAAGKVQGEAEAILPAATIEAQTVAKKAQTIINDANLDNAVGYDYWRPDWAVPNDVIVTRSRIQELMGGAFLQGVVLLQGTGPLTEKEGAAAASSLSRMELAMKSSNPKDFKEALRDYSEAVNNGVAKLAAKARKPTPNLPVPNVSGGSVITTNDGYTIEPVEPVE